MRALTTPRGTRRGAPANGAANSGWCTLLPQTLIYKTLVFLVCLNQTPGGCGCKIQTLRVYTDVCIQTNLNMEVSVL